MGAEGLLVGLLLAYHGHDWFQIGLSGTFLVHLFEETSYFVGGSTGARLAPKQWLRLELLGELGFHKVTGIGNGFGSDPVGGQSAVGFGYVGGQGSAAVVLGRNRNFTLGSWFGVWADLGRQTVHTTVETCFLGCSIHEEVHTVGAVGWTTGLLISRVFGDMGFW